MIAKPLATVEDLYSVPDNGNVGFIVDLPDRTSFSPDVAWYTGQLSVDKLFA